MATISRTKTWNSGDVLTASDLNAEFDNILTDYNGNISNANVAANAAIAGSKLASTLTGKTFGGSLQALGAASDAATITFDLASTSVYSVTLGGARTLAVSNAGVGQFFVIRLKQDATGSRTVTWFSTINWVGGSAPTLTTSANKTDVFGFLCTASNTFDGYIVGQNI